MIILKGILDKQNELMIRLHVAGDETSVSITVFLVNTLLNIVYATALSFCWALMQDCDCSVCGHESIIVILKGTCTLRNSWAVCHSHPGTRCRDALCLSVWGLLRLT
jgi:hypothetical protein